MATIPLYNGGQVGAVSTGVRVPLVAERAVTDPSKGIGQGLVHLGVMGSQAALQMREADDTTGMMKADGLMQQHYADQQLFQKQNPDQKTWLPEWQKRVGTLQDQLSQIDLSPRKRAILDQSMPVWSNKIQSQIGVQALEHSENVAKVSVANQAAQFAKEGNQGGVASLEPMLPSGMPAPMKQNFLLPFMEQAKQTGTQNALTNADNALSQNQFELAKSWFGKAREMGGISQEKHDLYVTGVENMKLKNDLASRIVKSDSIAGVQDMIANAEAHWDGGKGRLPTALYTQLQQDGMNKITRLDAQGAQDWMKLIKGGLGDKQKAQELLNSDGRMFAETKASIQKIMDSGIADDPISYAGAYAEAKTFPYDEGSPEYDKFLSKVEMMIPDGPQKNSIMDVLQSALKTPKDAQHRAFNEIYSMAADDLKKGVFGAIQAPLDKPDAVLPPKVRSEIDTIKGGLMLNNKVSPEDQQKPDIQAKYEREARVKWWENLPEKDRGQHFNAYMIDDETMRKTAFRSYQDTLASLEKWHSDNPKATPQQLRSQYESLLDNTRIARPIPNESTVPGPTPLLPPPSPKDLNDFLKKHGY